jgi:formylglycine-generating enzyme required for sulfatase activity
VERALRVSALLQGGVRPAGPRFVNSAGMEFALIPAGTFLMGSAAEEEGSYNDERPVHQVEITRPFYLSVTAVTQEQYEKVIEENPSSFAPGGYRASVVAGLDTNRYPVETVSWYQAIEFCEELEAREGEEGRHYRLPTEAQWEYACRAWGPNALPFHHGFALDFSHALFDWEAPYSPQAKKGSYTPVHPCPVASFPPNAFGLSDMHGNVDEWCADAFASEHYANSPRSDPTGPAIEEDDDRVVRGGSYRDDGRFCRAAVRIEYDPQDPQPTVGFRVVCLWPTRLP